MPTCIVCTHSHLFLALPPQRKPETESKRERDCTQRSTRATLLQRYLSAYNKDVASNKVATPLRSRIANIFCLCVIGKQQQATFCASSYISIVLSAHLGRFSQNGSHINILCVWCVCMCVCDIILEHEDKNVRAELIWRLLIATVKTSIHLSQSKFYFHVQRSLKHTTT